MLCNRLLLVLRFSFLYGNLWKFQNMTLPQFILTESQSCRMKTKFCKGKTPFQFVYKLTQSASQRLSGVALASERRLSQPDTHNSVVYFRLCQREQHKASTQSKLAKLCKLSLDQIPIIYIQSILTHLYFSFSGPSTHKK